MKKFQYKFNLVLLAAISMFAACSPIEDNDSLKNSFNPDDIMLDVIQDAEGGNMLTLQMQTEGVTGYWDYLIDRKYSDEATIIFPFTGTFNFTYHVTTPYMSNNNPAEREYIEKTITVEVKTLNEALNPAYYALVGDELQGKSWVFDQASGSYWYMVNGANSEEVWWNPHNDGVSPSDVDGKMEFNLSGGANYLHWQDAAGEPVEGSSFTFSPDFTKLTISGETNILGSEQVAGNDQVFDIIELTETSLKLFVSNTSGGTGWVWSFVPES